MVDLSAGFHVTSYIIHREVFWFHWKRLYARAKVTGFGTNPVIFGIGRIRFCVYTQRDESGARNHWIYHESEYFECDEKAGTEYF